MALFCKNGEHVEAGTGIHWGAGIEGAQPWLPHWGPSREGRGGGEALGHVPLLSTPSQLPHPFPHWSRASGESSRFRELPTPHHACTPSPKEPQPRQQPRFLRAP